MVVSRPLPSGAPILARGPAAVATALLAVATAACGAPDVVPELTATPLPDSRPAADLSPADAPAPAAVTDPTTDADDPQTVTGRSPGAATPAAGIDGDEGRDARPTADRPRSSDAAMAALAADHVAGARSSDHVATDVTGDGDPDLVVAAVATDDVLTVTLATWDGERYAERGAVSATAVDRAGTPLARDLDRDGRAEVLAPFTTPAGGGVVVAVVGDDDALALPPGCPLVAPTELRVRLRSGRAAAVRLTCEPRTGGRGDDVLVLPWDGRHFVSGAARTQERAGPRAPTDGDVDRRPGRGDDPPGRGRGPDGNGPPGRGGRD